MLRRSAAFSGGVQSGAGFSEGSNSLISGSAATSCPHVRAHASSVPYPQRAHAWAVPSAHAWSVPSAHAWSAPSYELCTRCEDGSTGGSIGSRVGGSIGGTVGGSIGGTVRGSLGSVP
eukprot:1194461-Rhodomonas_salina.1